MAASSTSAYHHGPAITEDEDSHINATALKLIDYIPIHISVLDHFAAGKPDRPPPQHKEKQKTRLFEPFARAIDFRSLFNLSKKWIKNPANMAVVVWLLAVGAGLCLLLLVVSGALDRALPESSIRKKWAEAINQILNALFTLMCLYQHPRLLHHAFLLLRWAPKDAHELREIYGNSTSSDPHERGQMAAILALLHLTCLSQYAICGLYWAYDSATRPEAVVSLLVALSIAAPAIAAAYTILRRLRTKQQEDDEPQREPPTSFLGREEPAKRAMWAGGLLDCGDDPAAACLSLWCTPCVFGWNAWRLGFGNAYVHIATLVLLCSAPVLVFGMAGARVGDEKVRWALEGSGVVMSFFGLMYGGFWRVRMRERFGLPGEGWAGDCARWVVCWWCALSQEVRTGDLCMIEENGSRRKGNGEEVVVAGFGSEGTEMVERSHSCPGKIGRKGWVVMSRDGSLRSSVVVAVEEEEEMAAPVPVVMEVQRRSSPPIRIRRLSSALEMRAPTSTSAPTILSPL